MKDEPVTIFKYKNKEIPIFFDEPGQQYYCYLDNTFLGFGTLNNDFEEDLKYYAKVGEFFNTHVLSLFSNEDGKFDSLNSFIDSLKDGISNFVEWYKQNNIYNNAQEVGNAKLVLDDGVTEISGLSTSEKILNSQGRDFYIVIPTNSSAYNVSIVVDADTEVTSSKLWTPTANIVNKVDTIVQVKKETIKFYESDTKTIQKPEFDLSLTSFVSKINSSLFISSFINSSSGVIFLTLIKVLFSK